MQPGNLVKLKIRIDESDEKLFGFVLEILPENNRKTQMYEGEEVNVLWYTSLEKTKWREWNGRIGHAYSNRLEIIG